PRARLELPVLRLDDGSQPPGERRLPYRQEDRGGLPAAARAPRAGSRSLHQARLSQRVAGDPAGANVITRRDFVKQATLAAAAMPVIARAQPAAPPLRVGMTDWNLGQRGDITKIALAREIGLDGIQVSVKYPTDGKTPTLRDAKTQSEFKRAALDNGIQICSLAIGNPGKSRLPMHTNPAFAILLVEAVEIAHDLGTNNI